MGEPLSRVAGTLFNPGGRDSLLPGWAKTIANPIGALTGSDPLQDLQDKATGYKPDGLSNDDALKLQAKASDGSLIAPDLTDETVRGAQIAALRRARQGAGLASTFLTGPLGSPVKPMKPLGGG